MKGVVAITGGTGMLGSLVAAWLVHNNYRHILAAGRTGKISGSVVAMDHVGVASLGAVKCDAAFATDMEALLPGSGCGKHPPTLGLMHASGVLRDQVVMKQHFADFQAVFAPKTFYNGHRCPAIVRGRDTEVHGSLGAMPHKSTPLMIRILSGFVVQYGTLSVPGKSVPNCCGASSHYETSQLRLRLDRPDIDAY
eukprot:scaffold220398_cov50-Prasinocladus_malaysianus.AAC.1